MGDHRKQPSGVTSWTLTDTIFIVIVVCVVSGLYFFLMLPVTSIPPQRPRHAAVDVQQIVTAVRLFYTEYGRYPTDSEIPDHQALFSVLRGDAGSGSVTNPRGIVFIESREATPHGRGNALRGGFGPDNTFYDPWGGVYEVRIDHSHTNTVEGPEGTVRAGVIAWTTKPNGELVRSWK